MSHLAVFFGGRGGRSQHLGVEVRALLALVWHCPGPLWGRSWGSESSILWPSEGCRGKSQLLLACLDAGIGLLVQCNIATLPGIQIEQWVSHNSWVKALLPQLCLLELEGP